MRKGFLPPPPDGDHCADRPKASTDYPVKSSARSPAGHALPTITGRPCRKKVAPGYCQRTVHRRPSEVPAAHVRGPVRTPWHQGRPQDEEFPVSPERHKNRPREPGLEHGHHPCVRHEDCFAYLTTVIDRYSGRILSRRVSNPLSARFCADCVKEAFV